MMLLKKKIVISTHQMVYGASHALRDFLNQNETGELLFIAHPINQVTDKSILEIFNKGKLLKKEEIKRSSSFYLLNYFLDLFYTLRWVLARNSRYDFFIGVDNLNCFAGLFLKKLGRVKKVIYYSIDFSPIRFKNKLLNFIYHQIEKLCVKAADETWNTSPRIAWGREKFLELSSKTYKQKVVPIGVWNKKVKKYPYEEINKHQLLFVGHLLEKQGVQKVLEAIPLVVEKIKDFRFLIVGGGEYETILRKKAKKLKIDTYVEFKGWIKDRKVLDNLMSLSAGAVALYKPEKERLYNFTYYADPTKLKDYLSAGLSIVLTNVPYNAKEIEGKGCGIVVPYRKKEVASAIISLLENQEKLKKYRENALRYSQEFDWNKIFKKALNL